MIHERYNNKSQLITDPNSLQLTSGTEVVIYREDQWHDEVFVDLEEQAGQVEELKPLIVFVAENLCKMDCIAQKYSKDNKFAFGYVVAYVCIDMPDRVTLTYFGTLENTEFDVVFQHINSEFILKSFGTVKDIPPNWDK